MYEAVQRLFFRHVAIAPSLPAFAVCSSPWGWIIGAPGALGKIAAKYDSQALEADALHFSTDVWSSGVVVLGLLLVRLGRTYDVHVAERCRSGRRVVRCGTWWCM